MLRARSRRTSSRSTSGGAPGSSPCSGAAAAVAACAALVAGLWGASVSSDLDEARSALARERAAAAVLAQPVSESSLTGAAGRLVVGEDGRAVLVVSSPPPVPAGKTYQMWVIDGGHPVSGGLFAPGDGTLAIPVDGKVGQGSVVAVTVEDDGGARGADRQAGDRVGARHAVVALVALPARIRHRGAPTRPVHSFG